MIRKAVAFFLCLVGFPLGTLFAQKPGLPFLNIGIGARSQSMGEAHIAEVSDASAIYWNPSALPRLESKNIFFYQSKFIADTSYSYFAYAHPFSRRISTLGIAFGRLSYGSIQGRDGNRQITGDFGANDSLLTLSFGRKIGRRLSVGVGINIIQSSIQSYTSRGIGLDGSFTYNLSPKMRVAAGFFHMGPSMSYRDESFQLPGTFSFGVSRKLLSFLTLTADSKYRVYEQKFSLSLGGELTLAKVADFRFGYLPQLSQTKAAGNSSSSVNGLTGLGMGVGLRLFSRVNLDYAFVPVGELGVTHHISMSWRFR